MHTNQNQQFIGHPSIYPQFDPLNIDNFLRRYELSVLFLHNAQVNYNQFLYENRNVFPTLQMAEQAYRDRIMLLANNQQISMPLRKRKATPDNCSECLQFAYEQRMAKIPKTQDTPLNLVTKTNARQINMMMMAPTPSTSHQNNYAFNTTNNGLNFGYQEFVAAMKRSPSSNTENREHSKFPKQFDDKMILGPNATIVDLLAYRSINFKSAKMATRQLLALVFPSHVLATHSLTGRPAPLCYGLENSAKMQLDSSKVADIIHCILSETNCKRQDIRAAITAKCCETARLFKNRSMRMAI